ncbi:MAG: tRNA epoxyqueuosine(34) reductase QueG [Prevotella sp.]|nr:tRNA epoxyqueuosine(34) reductase QueG [Prevotella sp.]
MSSRFSNEIKAEALRLGFFACGISKARPVDDATAQQFTEWLSEGRQAGMHYMENHLDKRLDPRLLMEGLKSIVSVALNYSPQKRIPENEYQIAAYAYGQDYHDIVKQKLHQLASFIADHYPTPDDDNNGQSHELSYRVFSDSAPVLERYWAVQAGLGWEGRNHQLIIPNAGSMFFLGELFLNIDLDYDTPQPNRCGTCRRCIEACPTKALTDDGFDANRCISYQTIENRSEIPSDIADKMGNTIYGCDRCQQACPWNRFAQPTDEPLLQPRQELLQMTKEKWKNLTEEDYRRLFKGSAVKRAKFSGLTRNIKAINDHETD